MGVRTSHHLTAFRAGFEHFEAYEAMIRDWDLDFRQLDRGPSPVHATVLQTPLVRVRHFEYTRRYEQRGSTPPGLVTFGLPCPGVEPLRVGQETAGRDSLVCFGSGAEFYAVNGVGFSGSTISLSVPHLEEMAADLGMEDALADIGVVSLNAGCDPSAVAIMKEFVDRLMAGAFPSPGSVDPAIPAARLEEDLTEMLVLALGTRSAAAHRPTPRCRDVARRRAVAFVEDNARRVPSVRRICEVTGVSWRTLDYAFKEFYGVSPKAFLQFRRLHGVRRALAASGPDTVIADVAARWGFWHMGQLAADYRRTFGELPSETLAR